MDRNEQLAVYWTRAQPTVAAFITSMVVDFNDAEDVLQQTAVALVRKFEDYDPQRPFVAWAIGMARNEVLKHRRSRAMQRELLSDDLLGQLAATHEEMADELDAMRRVLGKCLEAVDGQPRQALDLRYEEDLKPAAIADRLGLAAGTVRVMLHRVRAALRECIERRLTHESDSDQTQR